MSHHHGTQSLNALAFSATVHCLTGCAIGEVLGVIIGTALGWSDAATIALAIAWRSSSATRSRAGRCCARAWRSAP